MKHALSLSSRPGQLLGDREIYDQAIVTLNWPLAATLSMIVLLIFGVALVLYSRLLRAVL